MRIYFCGSIRGGRQDVVIYQRIVQKLEKYGQVLTEHVSHGGLSEKDRKSTPLAHMLRSHGIRLTVEGKPDILALSMVLKGEDAVLDGEKAIHDRDLEWLVQSDVIIAEVTQPSLGVGYELGRAITMKKRILCLFRPSSDRALSAMIRGAHDGSLFQVCDYSVEEVEGILEDYFDKLTKV